MAELTRANAMDGSRWLSIGLRQGELDLADLNERPRRLADDDEESKSSDAKSLHMSTGGVKKSKILST